MVVALSYDDVHSLALGIDLGGEEGASDTREERRDSGERKV